MTVLGDPTPVGFVTVALYILAAVMCARASIADGKSRRVWRFLALLMLALGLNKQLDLQTLLTELGRSMARSENWYAYRRTVQLAFVLAMGVGSVVFAIAFAFAVRSRSRPLQIAVVGTVMLAFFVTARAASFHHVDVLLASRWRGLPWNVVLETGGISIIILSAWRQTRHCPCVSTN